MAYTEVTKENFEDLINNNDTVIIDYWAPWCGPCRSFGPIFEKVSEDHDDIVFGKCNTEEQQAIAYSLKIQSIPTLMVFREKILIFRQAGALPEPAFRELVDKVKSLDMDEVRAEIKKQEEEEKNKADQES